MMKKKIISVFVIMALVFVFAGCSSEAPTPTSAPASTPTLPDNVVLSVKTSSAPALDGKAESLWDNA